jgi:hypothetical protein
VTGGFDLKEILNLCYADDGAIRDMDPAKVQVLADAFTDRSTRLHMNEIKTKGMVVIGAQAPNSQSLEVFSHLHKGEGV